MYVTSDMYYMLLSVFLEDKYGHSVCVQTNNTSSLDEKSDAECRIKAFMIHSRILF